MKLWGVDRDIEELITQLEAENARLDRSFRLACTVRTKQRRLIGAVVPSQQIEQIMEVVCAQFELPLAAMTSRRRDEGVVIPRHLFCWLARSLTQATVTEIALAIRRDHTSVSYAVYEVINRMDVDPTYAARARALLDACQQEISTPSRKL